MDNLSVADIHGNMVHLAAAACVEYQIAGLMLPEVTALPILAWEPE